MTQPAVIEVGEVLAGKYRVEAVLGQGGMGVVVKAHHLQLEEPVAIKMMLAAAAADPDAVARFVREARAAARLQSAHVARVSDVGTFADGRAYMVMEYLEGSDLTGVLETSGPLPITEAVDYVLQAGEALAEAHSLGIVHRDLKPSNLFLTRRRDRTPHIKVLDFGISKIARSAAAGERTMTETSALMGTPLYMSPEQMTSARDVDARADIWALGVVLYELLTGELPFVADTLPQICAMVLQAPAPALRLRRPDAPAELEATLQRCLQKRPGDRFQTMAEMALALERFAGPHGRASLERTLALAGGDSLPAYRSVPPQTMSGAVPGATPAPTHSAWGDTKPPLPKRRSLFWVAAPLVLFGVGGAAAFALRGTPTPAPPTLDSSAAKVTAAEAVAPAPPVPPPPPLVVIPAPVASAESVATPAASPAPRRPSSPVEKRAPIVMQKGSPLSVKPATAKPAQAPAAATAAPAPASVAKPESKKPVGLGGRL